MQRVAGVRAGWFADPAGRFRFRYWTGTAWTERVRAGTGGEESSDALEVRFQEQAPRPVLPATATGEANAALARGVTPEPVAPRAALARVPRPGRLIAALLLGGAAVAGLAVLLLGVLPKGDAGKTKSAAQIVKSMDGTTTTAPDGLSASGPASTVHIDFPYGINPSKPGTYGIGFPDVGLGVKLPSSWSAFSPSSALVEGEFARAGRTMTPDEQSRLQVLAVDVDAPSITLEISRAIDDPSVLDHPEVLAALYERSPGVVASGVHAESVRVAGRRAVRVDAPVTERALGGNTYVGHFLEYLVQTRRGMVSVVFHSTADVVADPTVRSIVSGLNLIK